MNAIDMSQFIAAKSDQLNGDDLIGGPRTITITKVTASEGADQPVAVHYEGDEGKPFKPCKTNRRVMVAIWGADAAQYAGRSMTVYRDNEVMFGGLKVGGIRISHMSHMEKETLVVVAKSKGKKAPSMIKPLVVQKQTQADAAAKWADAYLAAVQTADDRVALEQFAESKEAKLAELQAKRPELYTQCADALQKRRAEFAPEGRADDQHGDQFPGDDDAFGDEA